jgi:hypothetical protein
MCWSHERSILGVNPATGKPLEVKAPPAWSEPFVAAVTPIQEEKADEQTNRTVQISEGICDVCGVYPCDCWEEDSCSGDIAISDTIATPAGSDQVVNGDGESVPFGVDEVI